MEIVLLQKKYVVDNFFENKSILTVHTKVLFAMFNIMQYNIL